LIKGMLRFPCGWLRKCVSGLQKSKSIEDVIHDIMSAPLGQDDRANELITYE
jgi:hypothetical protein